MSKHECDCCRVYGPIPPSSKLTREERKAIRKETEEAMRKFRREKPKEYKELVDSLRNYAAEKNE